MREQDYSKTIQLVALMVLGASAFACYGTSAEHSDDGGSGANAGSSAGGATSGGSANGGSGRGGSSRGGATSIAGTSSGGSSIAGASDGCEIELNQADLDTGFETCTDGSKRRRAVLECPTERTSDVSPCMPGFGPPQCMSDAECTDEPLGYCANAHNLTGYCGCYYGCRNDSDCGAGEICECGIVVGRCLPASCTTNQDCEPGFGCVASVTGSASPTCINLNPALATTYACQSADDECSGNQECPGGQNATGVCLLDGDHRVCGTACQLTP